MEVRGVEGSPGDVGGLPRGREAGSISGKATYGQRFPTSPGGQDYDSPPRDFPRTIL